ncbi:hypothetical protein YC68_24175, partial [Vibrio parahaemolyticus]
SRKDAQEIKIEAIARKFLAYAKKVTQTDFSRGLISEGKDLADDRYITEQQGSQFDLIIGCVRASKISWLIFGTMNENDKAEEQMLSATVDVQRPVRDLESGAYGDNRTRKGRARIPGSVSGDDSSGRGWEIHGVVPHQNRTSQNRIQPKHSNDLAARAAGQDPAGGQVEIS